MLLERKYQHKSFLNYLQIHELSSSLVNKSQTTWKKAIKEATQAESKKDLEKAMGLANKAVGIRARSENLASKGK